jgi:capsule polysaccharide export protein KpsC/LpsZ
MSKYELKCELKTELLRTRPSVCVIKMQTTPRKLKSTLMCMCLVSWLTTMAKRHFYFHNCLQTVKWQRQKAKKIHLKKGNKNVGLHFWSEYKYKYIAGLCLLLCESAHNAVVGVYYG